MSWSESMEANDLAVAAYFDDVEFMAIAMRRPERDVNGGVSLDPDRSAFPFLGSIDVEPSFNQIGSSERPSAGSFGDRRVSKTCLTAHVADWPWMLRQGDHIEGNDERYMVAANPDRDGSNRVAVWLNKVGV